MKKLTKEQYDQLPEFMQSSYTLQDDGSYALTDSEDLGALKRAKQHEADKRAAEVKRRKAAEAKLAEYEASKAESEEAANKKAGDIEALEASYQAKLTKQGSEKDAIIDKLKGQLTGLLVDNQAASIAESISTVPALMLPLIKQRLTADLEGDTPTTRILDAEGQMSALTIDELKDEFLSREDLKSVMIGTKASGGGSDTKPNSEYSFSTGGGEAKKSLTEMSDEELTAHITRKNEEQTR